MIRLPQYEFEGITGDGNKITGSLLQVNGQCFIYESHFADFGDTDFRFAFVWVKSETVKLVNSGEIE